MRETIKKSNLLVKVSEISDRQVWKICEKLLCMGKKKHAEGKLVSKSDSWFSFLETWKVIMAQIKNWSLERKKKKKIATKP